MNYRYQYRDPLLDGFRRVKLSRKDHNRILTKRRIKWCHRYDYFMRDDEFLMRRFVSLPAVILTVLLFPLACLAYGFANKGLWREIRGTLMQKKYGSFSSDQFKLREDDQMAQELLAAIGKHENRT